MSARKAIKDKKKMQNPAPEIFTFDPTNDLAEDMIKYGSNFLALSMNLFETVNMFNNLIILSFENEELANDIGTVGWCVINPIFTMSSVMYKSLKPIRDALMSSPLLSYTGASSQLLIRMQSIRPHIITGITDKDLDQFLTMDGLDENAPDDKVTSYSLDQGIQWAEKLEEFSGAVLLFISETPCIGTLWPNESRSEFIKYADLLVQTMKKIRGLSYDKLERLHDEAFKPKSDEKDRKFDSKVAIDNTLAVLDRLATSN